MITEGKKVLVVDDDETARDFVHAIMEGEGWEVVEATNGREALDMVQDEEPSLIILDVNMPEIDGFETFRALRSDLATEDIPIIMLTAINEIDPSERKDEAWMEEHFGLNGPEGFVDKPVDPTFLLNTVFGVVG